MHLRTKDTIHALGLSRGWHAARVAPGRPWSIDDFLTDVVAGLDGGLIIDTHACADVHRQGYEAGVARGSSEHVEEPSR